MILSWRTFFFNSIYHPTLLLASIPVFTRKHILFIFICTAWSTDPVAQKSFNKSTLNSKEVGELGKRQSLKLNERKKDHNLPERSPGNGNLLQYSCLENPMYRGAWRATVHGVAELDMAEQLTLPQTSLSPWKSQLHLLVLQFPYFPPQLHCDMAEDWNCIYLRYTMWCLKHLLN